MLRQLEQFSVSLPLSRCVNALTDEETLLFSNPENSCCDSILSSAQPPPRCSTGSPHRLWSVRSRLVSFTFQKRVNLHRTNSRLKLTPEKTSSVCALASSPPGRHLVPMMMISLQRCNAGFRKKHAGKTPPLADIVKRRKNCGDRKRVLLSSLSELFNGNGRSGSSTQRERWFRCVNFTPRIDLGLRKHYALPGRVQWARFFLRSAVPSIAQSKRVYRL